MKLIISPHNDDETLFTAFSICASRPHVRIAVVFDSHVQVARGYPHSAAITRRQETISAMRQLGINEKNIDFLGVSDLAPKIDDVTFALAAFETRLEGTPIEWIYSPAFESRGHAQHNLVAWAMKDRFSGVQRIQYLTYTDSGKSRSASLVPFQHQWVGRKLRALACYASQHEVDNCRPHFTGDLHEYYLE